MAHAHAGRHSRSEQASACAGPRGLKPPRYRKASRRLLAGALIASLGMWPLAAAPRKHPRLLVISVDGLMPSTSYLDPDSRAPTMRAMAARGAWTKGVTGIWPTNTVPSHTTLLTGVPPGVHGIADNHILDPERRANPSFNWFARDIKVPTLATAAHAAGLSTAVLMWPVSVGLDATYLVPSFAWQEHPGELKLLRALSTPHLLDEFERATGAPFAWPPNDRQRADLASFIARAHRPDVMLVYFGTLDAFQHTYGPGAPMTASALHDIDGLLDRILSSLQSRHLLDDTYVALVSDHGFVNVEHAVGPNTAFKQEGLIETDPLGRIARWQAISHGTGGSSLVYVPDRSNQALVARVRGILDTLRADDRAGIDRILDHDELVAAGADPAAAFAIAMRLGYAVTEDLNTLFSPPYIRAMHGYPAAHPEMNASFILVGPGLAGVGDIGLIRMTQIAPTLARLLGVTLSPQADTPIAAIVKAATK